MDFRVLCLGDVVGRPGRKAIELLLPGLQRDRRIDAVIVNGENVAGGSGLPERLAEKLLAAGVDVITSGDHIWRRQGFADYLQRTDRVVRPCNYPPKAAGKGYTIVETARGVPIAVVNVLGRVFMDPVDCPFRAVDAALELIGERARVIIVDVHAEATSEKQAMGRHCDGRVSAVVGTHTHVPTADETVLPGGTGYITDLGLTGPYEAILGREIKPVLYRFLTGMYAKFDVAKRDARVSGVIVTVDTNTGRASAIERLHERLPDDAHVEEEADA